MRGGKGKVAESRASEGSGEGSSKNRHNGRKEFNTGISSPMLGYADSSTSLFQSKGKLKVSPRGSIVARTTSTASVSDSEGMASWLLSARQTASGSNRTEGKEQRTKSMKISTVEVDALL